MRSSFDFFELIFETGQIRIEHLLERTIKNVQTMEEDGSVRMLSKNQITELPS